MPLVNKKPFVPNPIPDNLAPDDEVFYHELTNEIFTSHDAFFDRFLYCNSLIWSCGRTGKSGLTYKEALNSELSIRKKKAKREKPPSHQDNDNSGNAGSTNSNSNSASNNNSNKDTSTSNISNSINNTINNDGDDGSNPPPVKKKKKKYPYDPKKYSMPVPEGFDPSLLTPTGKIDGRKLKSKKNKQLADELLACQSSAATESDPAPKKKGKHKRKEDEAKKKEDEAKKKEEDVKKKAQLQAELAKERELEVKRKKEAANLAKQLERQKKEEERKKAAAFLQNWEKKCEDLERDDLRKLPQPTPLHCDIPEKMFGDAIFISESLYNIHEVYEFSQIFPDGQMSYDTLEEMLIDKQEEGPLGTVIQFLLRLIFNTQPTGDGYGLDDDPSKAATTSAAVDVKQEVAKTNNVKQVNANPDIDGHHESDTTCLGSEGDEEDEENDDKDVNMNDLIGSAIKAAQEVKKALSKPLVEMEIDSSNVTEILRLHLLQSGSFPKGRTIYNGWYSSREDPGLWLCMQEPDLIKRLGEVTVYDLETDEKIKILHTLIYQLFTFIKTRNYIESASDQLTELRKSYRKEAADFARWDRENCVKRMQPPKKKSEQSANSTSEKSNGVNSDQDNIKPELNQTSNPCSINGDDGEYYGTNDKDSNTNQHLKSCLKTNGTSSAEIPCNDGDDLAHSKKKISFKTGMNGAIDENGLDECENDQGNSCENGHSGSNEDSDQTFEELERAYQQNQVDYEDYQRERTIRYEQLNQTLVAIRKELRTTQSVYGIHPIGRDRAYRRYWIFQSLPGLYVEQDDEYVGKCLPEPTPLESRYKKLFNKDNPLMHPNEADLIRTKTCDVGCSTDPIESSKDESESNNKEKVICQKPDEADNQLQNGHNDDLDKVEEMAVSDRLGGCEAQDDGDEQNNPESFTSDEVNYCTGDETTCAIHGQKRPTQTRWWFYHQPESIDSLIECLNKRGFRENELQEVLSSESSVLKPWVSECPAYKLNKSILGQSGIRRSQRLRTKGGKRRGRRHHDD